MYETIIDLIDSEQYQEALKEINAFEEKEVNDELAILKATIYERKGEPEYLFEAIREGLTYNPENGELYYMLGNYYSLYNKEQAYLCYENARHYLHSDQDKHFLKQKMSELRREGKITVQPVSIVILSYNTLEYTRKCIESIWTHCASGSYEVVVVDNASHDGSVEWLREQKDIVLVEASKNEGFPRGCNLGVKAANATNDIFFLNSDTLLVDNSLFYLRMALYAEERIGASGSVTSMAGNWQMIEEKFDTLKEYLDYGRKNNIPEKNAIEERVKLSGFAMLVKRNALDRIGLFDERFSPGNYEDDDLSVRLMQAGFSSVLCHNSFIFHYGSISFGKEKESYKGIVEKNNDKFKEKWGFEMAYYSHSRKYIFDLMDVKDTNDPIQILDVGCGLGATMLEIKYHYPNARVYGIEISKEVARLAGKIMDVIEGDIESNCLPYSDGQFDYIIFSEVLEHLKNPEKVMCNMRRYLKDSGEILASIPNVMHVSVIEKLIKGTMRYQEAGILDKTHLHFFTLDTIIDLAANTGFIVNDVIPKRNAAEESSAATIILDKLSEIDGAAGRDTFLTYQYCVSLKKNIRDSKEKTNHAEKEYFGKKILVYQADSPYGALQSFMNHLLLAFREFAVQITVVDLAKKDALEQILMLSEQPFDAVFSFNCYISNIKLQNGMYLQDCIHAPYYYYLLDHPMHHHAILKEPLKDFHAFCVDDFFVEYIKKYYPHIRSVHALPHGGSKSGIPVPYRERQIDVLFTGTYKPCDQLLQLMKDSDPLASKISLALAEEILSHPELRQEEAFANVLQFLDIKVSNEQFAEWLNVVGNIVDHYIRGVYRNRLLETMAGTEFRVEIYGEGWEQCEIQADNIHYHSAIDFEENLVLMNQAKIVINTYTGFKSGAHERVFSTMLSKALCLSERNAYLENHFIEGKEIVFFDYSNLEEFTNILSYYLTNLDETEYMTERACRKVQENHMWNNRAQEMLRIMFNN